MQPVILHKVDETNMTHFMPDDLPTLDFGWRSHNDARDIKNSDEFTASTAGNSSSEEIQEYSKSIVFSFDDGDDDDDDDDDNVITETDNKDDGTDLDDDHYAVQSFLALLDANNNTGNDKKKNDDYNYDHDNTKRRANSCSNIRLSRINYEPSRESIIAVSKKCYHHRKSETAVDGFVNEKKYRRKSSFIDRLKSLLSQKQKRGQRRATNQ